MKRPLSMAILAIVACAGLTGLAACSSSGSTSTTAGGSGTGATAPAGGSSATSGTGITGTGTAPASSSNSCSGGAKAGDPGVVSVNCDGTADFKYTVGSLTGEMTGGTCHTVSGFWSATVGVIVDATGLSGTKYSGPPVKVIAIAASGGTATIQITFDGKNLSTDENSKITLSSDQKTAHLTGTTANNSDEPGQPVTVDVTC